ALPYGACSGLAIATFTKRASFRSASVEGGATGDFLLVHKTMRPRAYIAFVAPSQAPACTTSSTNETFAAAKTSKGPPSWICFARRPVDPNDDLTSVPVMVRNASPISPNAPLRSAAAATRSGFDGGAAFEHPPRTTRAAMAKKRGAPLRCQAWFDGTIDTL